MSSVKPIGINLKLAIFKMMDQMFGVDLRSLALFRVGMGIILIHDLFIRALSLEAHYTDLGVLPRFAVIKDFLNPWIISIHFISGKTIFIIILFLIAGLAHMALLIGWRTRVAAFISWFFYISIQSRNPMVVQGGDVLLRMLLFWGIFLPMGAKYSVDSALNSSENKPPDRIISGASAALLLQVCFMYWFTASLKSDPIWTYEGTAIYYALNLDLYVTYLGKELLKFPELLKLLSFSTYGLEMLGPLLLFFPLYNGAIRLFLVFAFILLHIGFSFCLHVGHFPITSSIAMVPFLPSFFWDKLSKRLQTSEREALKIYYDETCSFCRTMVCLIKTFFFLPLAQVLPAQQNTAIFQLMNRNNSWVLVDYQGKEHIKFEAVVYACKISPLFRILFPLISFKFIQRLGILLYDWVANHRSIVSQFISFFKFRPLKWKVSSINSILAVLLLSYVFFWNYLGLPEAKWKIPHSLKSVGYLLRIDQYWDMFAPYPMIDDGWYVIPGKLRDGSEIDLFKEGQPVTWKKPNLVSATFKTYRWRKYMVNLLSPANDKHLLYYGQHLCREWNLSHDEEKQLETFEIDFMEEESLPDYVSSQPHKNVLWNHSCFKKAEE